MQVCHSPRVQVIHKEQKEFQKAGIFPKFQQFIEVVKKQQILTQKDLS
jgi:hypothetical protein